MGTIAGNARAVFDRFRSTFDQAQGSADWSLTFRDDDEVLTWAETKAALDLLEKKGLIQKDAAQRYRLTDAGIDVCFDPESLHDYVPRPAP